LRGEVFLQSLEKRKVIVKSKPHDQKPEPAIKERPGHSYYREKSWDLFQRQTQVGNVYQGGIREIALPQQEVGDWPATPFPSGGVD